MHLCICVCHFWFSKNCTKEKNKQTHTPTLAFHSYKIGLKPRTIGALLLPACCWFLVIAQSIRHTAGTPSCGGATGLWSTWLWRYVGPTAPMRSRSTDGLSICLLVGSTDWVSPSSPIPCEQYICLSQVFNNHIQPLSDTRVMGIFLITNVSFGLGFVPKNPICGRRFLPFQNPKHMSWSISNKEGLKVN